MQYRNLGRSGLKISPICLGTMMFGGPTDEATSSRIVAKAREAGINFIDSADAYNGGNSEKVVGRAISSNRENWILATKLANQIGSDPNHGGLSRRWVLQAAEDSLKRLGTDFIDLYQFHGPDPFTPMEETLRAADDLVRAGKVRYLGASSMYAWQLAKAQHVAERHDWHRFVSMQGHYNLAYREEEREMVPLCLDQGLGLLPYSPLARGLLTGSRRRAGGGTTTRAVADPAADSAYGAEDFDVVEALCEVAEELGRPPAQVALAWLRTRPGVTAPIVGATKLSHLEDALASLELVLDHDTVTRLEAAYRPHPVSGPE
jgi:1-deoxyxylulose-5-phosphate synthase